MAQIYPAIISKNFLQLDKNVKLSERFVHCKWVQIDVMDGVFVPNKTVGIKTILKLKTTLDYELHLMVQNPEKSIANYLRTGAKRFVVHYESTDKLFEVLSTIKKNKKKASVALNPSTSLKVLKPFMGMIDSVLLMSVDPGFYGSKFKHSVYSKIKSLRRISPRIKISVDGGVSLTNAKRLVSCGADILCVGSNVFKTSDPTFSYSEILKKIKK